MPGARPRCGDNPRGIHETDQVRVAIGVGVLEREPDTGLGAPLTERLRAVVADESGGSDQDRTFKHKP